MRELNECTAEVFRRGEQRLKERRRKRRRALAVCIPVFLIAAVWPAIIFPPMVPEMATDPLVQTDGETAGSAPEALACPYTAAEIQEAGQEHYRTTADTAAVAEMFWAVQSLFADADGNGQIACENNQSDKNFPAEENNKNGDLIEASGKSEGYTITFTAGDGSQAVYDLSGNTLVNTETKETIILSDSQAAELMAVLGLAE